MFIVYILYSHSIKKFYTGFTSDLEKRMEFHNSGMNNFTSKGVPWIIVHTFIMNTKFEAITLENTIKNGAKRYLERNNIVFSL